MKIVKCLFTLICTVFILIATLPLPAFAADDDNLHYGKKILAQMDNAESLLYAYDLLIEGCANAKEKIKFESRDKSVTSDELMNIYTLLCLDYPEYYWLSGLCSITSYKDTNKAIYIEPDYLLTGDALTAAKAAVNAKVSELTAGLSGKSNYEKSLVLHDRLIKEAQVKDSIIPSTAYHALVNGAANRFGYSKAYQLLLHKVGIPAFNVTGSVLNTNRSCFEGHEWTLACIDGKWYYTDVMLDDQGDSALHGYFNITSAQMDENHCFTIYEEYLPKATSTAANYFVKNDCSFSKFNVDLLVKILKAGNNSANIFVTGDVKAFQAKLAANISTIASKLGLPAGSEYSYSASSLGREIVIKVNFIASSHKHKTTHIAKKSSTCVVEGNEAYYACDCEKWFEDSTATKEIMDKTSVVIPVIDHPMRGWSYDKTHHWRTCHNCNVMVPGTKVVHSAADKSGICDVCSIKYEAVENGVSSQTNKPSSSATNNTSSATNNTSSQAGKPSSTAASSTSSAQQGGSSGGNEPANSTISGNEVPSDTPAESTSDSKAPNVDKETSGNPNKPNKDKNDGGKSVLPWAIPVACAVVLAGGVTGVIIFIKKR